MAFSDDKELKEYRNLIQPPDTFADGFSWKTVAGALFLGFLVNPVTVYLSLVLGHDPAVGSAMKWVMVIFFAEVAKRSFTQLRSHELFTLQYMTGLALAHPMQGFLWKQYFARSDYVRGLGLAAELPSWAFPTRAAILDGGNTFFTWAWAPVIALAVFSIVLSKFTDFGLGYVLYRLVNDVEKLPFPFAPVQASGIMALSTDRSEEEPYRWRCFAIGGAIGMIWGGLYLCVPVLTEAFLGQRVELIPLIFIDLTPQIGEYLPAMPFNLVLNLGAFLTGMVVPFWGVVGSVVGVVFTAIANPILQHYGFLPNWRPEMGFVNTQFSNYIDFYLSFSIGLSLAVAFSQLGILLGKMVKNVIKPPPKELRHEKTVGQRFREGWKILVTNNTKRGDYSIFLAVGLYFALTASWIGLGLFLVPGYPWLIMIFYGVIYNPLISYATAKLEGLCGRAIAIPYIKEITILLSGHKGADIWFAPMPIQNLGVATVGYRVLELTGTKVVSKFKTICLVTPIVIVASLMTAELIWKMGDVPNSAFPFTQMMWELQLKKRCVILTSTLEGGSQFLEAWHFSYAITGFLSGSILFAVLTSLGLPIMLVFGAVWGLNQGSPGALVCSFLGALVGKFYFRRKFKDMWLKYMVVVVAGFGCGMGLVGMVGIAVRVIKGMLEPTLW